MTVHELDREVRERPALTAHARAQHVARVTTATGTNTEREAMVAYRLAGVTHSLRQRVIYLARRNE